MNVTSIGWTDFTSNPIRYRNADGKMVWACERASPACAHCYAADLAKRYGRGGGKFTKEELATYTPYFDFKEARKILKARTIKGKTVKGSRCFIGDMTDVFGEWVPDALLDQLFGVMALRSHVTFQLLTKRPERMRAYFADVKARQSAIIEQAATIAGQVDGQPEGGLLEDAFLIEELWGNGKHWPLPNVWLGVSVENQVWADKRIPILLETPATVRFISAEPLLKPIDLTNIRLSNGGQLHALGGTVVFGPQDASSGPSLNWGIGGGESGNILRDPGVEAFVGLATQFTSAGVPFFMKQDVHRKPGKQGRIPNDIWALKQFPKAAA